MSWAQDTKLRFKMFALLITVVCPIFLVTMGHSTLRQIASNSWPHVGGTVIQPLIKSQIDKHNNELFYGRVQYRYRVKEREYTSDLTDLGPGAKHRDQRDAINDVAAFRPGKAVEVYYDPDDPSVGILTPGVPGFIKVLLIGLAVASVVGAVSSFFILRGWIGHWRQRNVAPQQPSALPPDTSVPVAYARPEILNSIGEITTTFRPDPLNLIAGGIFTLALTIGGPCGAVALYYAKDNPRQTSGDVIAKQIMIAFAAVVLPLAGLALGAWVKRLASTRVSLGANGIAHVYCGKLEVILWDQIQSIDETITLESLPIAKVPGAAIPTEGRLITICKKDGGTVAIGTNSVRHIRRLSESLQQIAVSHNIAYNSAEVAS